MLLETFLDKVIVDGRVTFVDWNGRSRSLGKGPDSGFTIRLDDRRYARRMALRPSLGVAEAYMDGALTIEGGSLYDFLDFAARNLARTGSPWLQRMRQRWDVLFRRIMQHNPLGRAQQNVAHHYDLSGALYDLFLDPDRQYSCAYFIDDSDSLADAQWQKKCHIAAKLLLEPGQKVLDIGSGWGGLGLFLARHAGVEVTGVTLSQEQHALSEQRARDAGLEQKARFYLRDYRVEQARYDRIVSVGMFEHVGVGHYQEYFDKVAGLLAEDGVALIHTIGRVDGPGVTDPFIRKYIFPGGYIPALSEVMPAIERAGLIATDIEILRLHYAKTLRAWRENFLARWDQAKALYDERFCRMWEFYLAGSEVSFRHMGMVVFQIQLARRQDAVPLTRDYITAWERQPLQRDNVAA